MGDKVSGSRLSRLTRLGWLSRRAIPIAWQRLKEATETPAGKRGALAGEALEKHADIAEEAFRTLGSMKGLALKIGQMVSYMDGALPAEYRAVYQKVLARLQTEAPALPWSAVEPLIARDLGRPIAELFASIEPEPFAAASIGQVHRGVLASGETVAVKVQYPGVDKAIRADLSNASLLRSMFVPLLRLSGRGTMSQNLGEVMAEVSARILEELDYRREADMQERFRLAYADDPVLAGEVRVPRVFRAASGARVLTTEFVRGRGLAEIAATASPAERDRYGQILTRVLVKSLYDLHLFNADPHPGNYLFDDDGRIVLLDFGCVKEIPDWMSRQMAAYLGAAVRATRTGSAADWATFDRAIEQAFKLDRKDPDAYDAYREFILYCLEPFLRDEPFTFTTEYTGASIDLALASTKKLVWKGKLPRIPNLPPVPADFTFISRVQWGFYSVLTILGATGNWHRLLPNHIRD